MNRAPKRKRGTRDLVYFAIGVTASLAVLALLGWGIFALASSIGGAGGGAIAGGVVGLFVALVSKAFDYQKKHEANILEKRKEVYRRLLSPWEKLLSSMGDGEDIDTALEQFDRAGYYASCFDAVLYGSDEVLQRFVEFRTQDDNPDSIDNLMALARLLLAMRKDVTGRTPSVSAETVLKMFINFKPEELVVLRLREYVQNNESARRRLAEVLQGAGNGEGDKEQKDR